MKNTTNINYPIANIQYSTKKQPEKLLLLTVNSLLSSQITEYEEIIKMSQNKIGTLYGISVGTGDPELITLKGLRLIKNTKVIAFPEGINNRLGVAEKIIAQWLQQSQIKVSLKFPYVKNQTVLEEAWHNSATKVWQYLVKGEDVAFACEGDIGFYSSFTHLARTIQKLYPNVKIVTIPGVCSPVAAASDLGFPLTVNHQRLTILPALDRMEELETALKTAEVVVLFKVNSVYQKVWHILQQFNLLESSYVVEKAGNSDRKIYKNLIEHPNLKLSYFSLLIVNCD